VIILLGLARSYMACHLSAKLLMNVQNRDSLVSSTPSNRSACPSSPKS